MMLAVAPDRPWRERRPRQDRNMPIATATQTSCTRIGTGGVRQLRSLAVPHVLLATDANWLFDDVDAALGGPDVTVSRIRDGADVLETTVALEPDLIILDLQIGNMGGMAASLAVKEDLTHEGLSDTPVLILLDRTDDVFLARRSEAEGWLVKPIDPERLRRGVAELLEGRPYREGWHDDAPEPTDAVTGPAN